MEIIIECWKENYPAFIVFFVFLIMIVIINNLDKIQNYRKRKNNTFSFNPKPYELNLNDFEVTLDGGKTWQTLKPEEIESINGVNADGTILYYKKPEENE